MSESNPLPHSTFDPEATVTSGAVLAREEMVGQSIGRYVLMEKLGEGGFGTVYVAEQREPVKRRVALKITKLGMDTKQVVARFEAERQALAMMDHPNIAKVLDAGATQTGRPYFVMELVNGIKITEYCDRGKLSTHKRLDLFIQVCRAIEHAHQKGIIHRDIKPSNILVTQHDPGLPPVPKVIDFGIAKATLGDLTDKTLLTRFDQFVGTPAYMSPEQAEMSGMDIDTRSDIYSLGVLLYELLTAQTPLEPKNLLARGHDEMRRMIREIEPLRPSLRLGQQPHSDSASAAMRHGTDAPKLIRLVRGDLDWVVMKCLEKDRTRRYDTAGSLAADVQRFLDNEPVEARSPGQLYRFHKLVRRNKLVFAAGAAIWVALVIGLGVSTWSGIKERQQRELAEIESKRAASARNIAEAARQIAEASRRQAEAARAQSEIERQQAEAARQKAEAALQQSEADRAKALAAEKRAEEARKEAEASRQEAESALQQARSEHNKANAAEKQAKDSQSLGQAALQQAEAADARAAAATAKSEQSAKTAAAEASLRQQAEAARQEAQAAAATALAQTGRMREAVSNLLTGLDALPPAEALKAAGGFLKPEDLKQPWAAQFLRVRGHWRARCGDWAGAAADFSQALNMDPADPALYHFLAPLLAQQSDRESYARHCAAFLARFGASNNPAAVKDCLLAPAQGVDVAALAARAREAVAGGTNQPQTSARQLSLALAEYRQGHFAEAAGRAEKALSGGGELGQAGVAQADAVLAMARQQLNAAEPARAALAAGLQILDTKTPKLESGDLGVQWPDWLAAHLLIKEAQEIVPAPTVVAK